MKNMSITDHIHELRGTAIRVFFILVISFFICYSVGDKISEFLLSPLRETVGDSGKIVFLGILDKILSYFQVSFWSAIIISSPFWFYEIWKFIKPGLLDKEVKVIRPFIFISFILFWAGVCFGQFLVFPLTFKTLLNFGVGNVDAMLSIKEYLVLASKVLVFLGIIFQLPNLILILAIMGIVNLKSLNEMRRYVYVGFTILSAMITPPDVITMLGLWVPLVMLFELGVVIVFLVNKKPKEKPIK